MCVGFVNGTKRKHYEMEKEQFCDERDGKKYVYVTIGSQIWMAENLNYAVSGSKCGDGSSLSDANTSTCDTYGRLYNWATAKTVCPPSWHLPSDAEWFKLTNFVGGETTAGTKLKAKSGWNEGFNSTDEFGFSALPGGYGDSDGSFIGVGNGGFWWSSSEYSAAGAYRRNMYYNHAYVGRNFDDDKARLYSVRCVQN
jgi:uncharacterized protein (TIGR02145 family)